MIALHVEDEGTVLTLENPDRVRGAYVEFERDGDTRRIVLEPRETKRVPVRLGLVYITYSVGVIVK